MDWQMHFYCNIPVRRGMNQIPWSYLPRVRHLTIRRISKYVIPEGERKLGTFLSASKTCDIILWIIRIIRRSVNIRGKPCFLRFLPRLSRPILVLLNQSQHVFLSHRHTIREGCGGAAWGFCVSPGFCVVPGAVVSGAAVPGFSGIPAPSTLTAFFSRV